MKRIVSFKLMFVISLLLLATIMTVHGTTFTQKEEFFSQTNGILNERIIAVPDSTILLKLWDEESHSGSRANRSGEEPSGSEIGPGDKR